MALTLINLSGFQRGVASDELSLNIETFTTTIKPEINEWLPGKDGQARGKAVGDPECELTIEGEMSGVSTGPAAQTFLVAFVPVNTVAYFGRSAGGLYLDEGTVTQSREGWKKLSAKFTSKFNVA